MRITTILGSPRKSGNTAAVLARFEGLAAEQHRVDRVNIAEHVVGGCLGCNACQAEIEEPGCVHDDDGGAILSRLADADAVVYSTPIYGWCYSAQMKALMDRHYCLVKWNEQGAVANALFAGKRAALLVTCGGDAETNADLIQVAFERQMRYLRCRSAGTFVVDSCSTPERLGAEADRAAREMYAALTRG